MAAYNLVNGRPCHVSPLLETELRAWARTTGHELFVVSDEQAPSDRCRKRTRRCSARSRKPASVPDSSPTGSRRSSPVCRWAGETTALWAMYRWSARSQPRARAAASAPAVARG